MSGITLPNPRDRLTRITIASKEVVLFDEHHYALLPWQEWRQAVGAPLNLLTIDHHTDTHPAFRFYLNGPQANPNRMALVSPSNAKSIEDAVLELKHDEHISAALQCDVLNMAVVIGHDTNETLVSNEKKAWDNQHKGTPSPRRPSPPVPPFTYSYPSNQIIPVGEPGVRIGDAAYRQWRDRIIEADYLSARIATADEICDSASVPKLMDMPFILDIDLDAFNTKKSIAPKDSSFFHDIIRKAHAISIAREHGCVVSCQRTSKKFTAAWLETLVIDHITAAMDGN